MINGRFWRRPATGCAARLKIEHDRTRYKQRNRIERMFDHLRIDRAIATR